MSDARPAEARTRVVLATRNAGKIADFQHLLDAAQLPIDVVSVGEFADLADTVETGVTFEENARLKADDVARATGLPALADDSGLAVDVLGGCPGVFSARWSGTHGADQANIDLLLAQTGDVTAARSIVEDIAWVPSLGMDFALRLGTLQWLLGLLVTGVGALALLYCAWYFKPDDPSLWRFTGVFTAFAGGLSRVDSIPGFDYGANYTTWIYGFVLLQASTFGGIFTGFSVARDFESGFASEPERLAENVRLAVATGVAGLSVEDRVVGEVARGGDRGRLPCPGPAAAAVGEGGPDPGRRVAAGVHRPGHLGTVGQRLGHPGTALGRRAQRRTAVRAHQDRLGAGPPGAAVTVRGAPPAGGPAGAARAGRPSATARQAHRRSWIRRTKRTSQRKRGRSHPLNP